jgi:hypothetical protein
MCHWENFEIKQKVRNDIGQRGNGGLAICLTYLVEETVFF